MPNGKIKPIMIRPEPPLRKKIEAEAQSQGRSMGNLLLIIVRKFFNSPPREPERHFTD